MGAIYLQGHISRLFLILFMFSLSFSSQARSLPEFTQLVEDNSPSVVNISTKQHKVASQRSKRDLQIPEFPEGSPFNELFKHFLEDGGPEAPPREYDAKSLGSGFIITEDGYILTNNHVVKEADEVIVRLSDYRQFEATIVGTDKRSDVALLKIDAKGLPKVKIGTTTELKVGEWVLAIGSPFGFDHSVTAGIVSAKGRNLPSENYVPFIQTDVAINPGNSGGPLFNLDGEVVGVNSQIYSRTGGFMGLSFAIPIEMAMNVVDQLRTSGKVSRGWLGVLIQDVTRELADSFGMDQPQGALIARVLPGSPAEKAGLQTGDIILKYNGAMLRNSSMLPPLVGTSRVDRPADVTVLRNGEKKKLQVNIGELPDEEALAKASGQPEQMQAPKLGLTVQEITPDLRKQMRLENTSGVMVVKILPGPARTAGLQEGDIIQMINNQKVENIQDYNQATADLPQGKTIAVLVQSKLGPRFLALHLPEE